MADQWFFALDKQRFGPFSAVQLKALAVLGRLQPKDVVWKNDIEQGVVADKVKHLFPAPTATLHPAPAAVAVADELFLSHQPPDVFPSVLQAIPTQSAEAPVVSEVSSDSPSLSSIEEQTPEPSPALTDAAGDEPQSPAADSKKKPPAKARATAVSGAVIVSQDGAFVKYRKKCTHCGCEDSSTRGMPIRVGATRDTFFCPKCRKKREVVIQGKR